MMVTDAKKLVAVYVKLRDDLAEQKKIFAAFEKGRKVELQRVADALQQIMDSTNVDSVKTEAGTAFFATKDFVSVEDWNATLAWVRETDTLELFNKAVNKTVVKEYMKDHEGQLPPGLAYGTQIEIQVRRPTK